MERQYDGVFFAWLFFAAMLIATGFILWQVHGMQFDTVNYDAWQESPARCIRYPDSDYMPESYKPIYVSQEDGYFEVCDTAERMESFRK